MHLETERLRFISLPLSVIRRRLKVDDFTAGVETPAGPLTVHFPPEWPGDALGFFATWAAHHDPADPQWGGTLVRTSDGRAIGQIGVKGEPDAAGRLEIGYGLNPEAWGQGYATEAVRALVAALLRRPDVRTVTAETATTNPASARVLEKSGFVRVGTGHNDEDGDLLLWTTPG